MLRCAWWGVSIVCATLLWSAPVLAAAPCPAPVLESNDAVERYIEQSEEEWAKSVATNDASVVRRILADDFVWVLDGRVLDKRTAVLYQDSLIRTPEPNFATRST